MRDEAKPSAGAEARPLISRALGLVFVAMVGTTVSFYLLLSVVPLYVTSIGAGGRGAGLATGTLMLSAVAAELVTPRLVARFGYRAALGAGLLLLGAPALIVPSSTSMIVVLVACTVRGLGFGIIVVVGSALVATLVPPRRRGEGLGLYGVVVGLPGVVALPLGVWLVGYAGYGLTFIAGALAALIGLVVLPGVPGRAPTPDQPIGVVAGLRTPAFARPACVFATTAMAGGIVVTFLPLAVPDGSGGLAASALLAQAATSAATRWWAGRFGDRHGPRSLLIPGVLASAAGMFALVMTSSPAAVLAGAVLFGAGFGITQNASLALMFARSSPAGYGTVSALWNGAYDIGLGLGAAGFGVLASHAGYPLAFALTGALILLAVAPAGADRRVTHPTSSSRIDGDRDATGPARGG